MARTTIDFTRAIAPGTSCGIEKDALLDQQADFAQVAATFLNRVKGASPELGFWNLPFGSDTIQEAISQFADQVDGAIRDVMVIGIGGSSLGGRTLIEALAGPSWLREGKRVHFPDNADPWHLSRLLESLKSKHTLVLVISKSGGTVETAAQMLIVKEWLGKTHRSHLIAITDPESGILRDMVQSEGLTSFSIPSNVGGRFSVFTPVGLLPAALVGIDIKALLSGAKEMALRCESTKLFDNPAGMFAVLNLMHMKQGRPLHVMMPYSDALRPLSAWFVQLWAESLGKRLDRKGNTIEAGPTPIAAVGATDQHAQVQLFIEGPRDKFVSFVSVAEPAADLVIPKSEGAYAYLAGTSLGQLLDAELRGTEMALAEDGRPSLRITLPELNARHLGALLFMLQAATAFAGEMLNIDAFNQPGVELGKKLAYGALGRIGYEQEAARLEQVISPERVS